MIWLFFVGVLGGLARALYGLLKSVSAGRRFRPGYFLLTLVTGGVLGGVTGLLFDSDPMVCALAGYVGSDVLENVAVMALPKFFVLRK